MDVLWSALWVMFVLFILYDTDAVYEYATMFTKWLPFLNRLTLANAYRNRPLMDRQLSYTTYLQIYHPSFMLNLMTCRYCTGVWLALATIPICGILEVPAIYLGGQLGYSLFTTMEKKLQMLREGDADDI
jgi:hypothetical protein